MMPYSTFQSGCTCPECYSPLPAHVLLEAAAQTDDTIRKITRAFKDCQAASPQEYNLFITAHPADFNHLVTWFEEHTSALNGSEYLSSVETLARDFALSSGNPSHSRYKTIDCKNADSCWFHSQGRCFFLHEGDLLERWIFGIRSWTIYRHVA